MFAFAGGRVRSLAWNHTFQPSVLCNSDTSRSLNLSAAPTNFTHQLEAMIHCCCFHLAPNKVEQEIWYWRTRRSRHELLTQQRCMFNRASPAAPPPHWANSVRTFEECHMYLQKRNVWQLTPTPCRAVQWLKDRVTHPNCTWCQPRCARPGRHACECCPSCRLELP